MNLTFWLVVWIYGANGVMLKPREAVQMYDMHTCRVLKNLLEAHEPPQDAISRKYECHSF